MRAAGRHSGHRHGTRLAHAVMVLAAGSLALMVSAVQAEPGLPSWASDKLRVASVDAEVAQAEPDVAKPEAARPEVAKSEAAKSEATKSETAKPDAPPSSPMSALPVVAGGNPRALYRALIEREVRHTSLPADVAEAVMGVESGYDPSRIGADGEIGLMQVMPATARMLGFSGTMAEFAVPENNIRYGVQYLSQAWSKAGGDLCTALMKYRAGHGETRFSQLSVDYCMKARARLVAKGYPVTGSVPVATFGFGRSLGGGGGVAMAGCRKRCLTIGGGRIDLAALNNRLAQVAIQVSVPRLGK